MTDVPVLYVCITHAHERLMSLATTHVLALQVDRQTAASFTPAAGEWQGAQSAEGGGRAGGRAGGQAGSPKAGAASALGALLPAPLHKFVFWG